MKHIILIFVIFATTQPLSAQEFDVRSFEADPTDLAARRFPRTTVNDEPAALIKVMTNIEGMIFDSNIGIVDVERREAEYWVYVAPRERRIRLMAPEFLAKDVSLPEPAQSHTVYQLVVTRKGMLAPITDLVRLTFRLNESDVFIRRGDQAPVSTIGNIAVFNIEKGEHSFRFIKEGFDEKTLTLDVGDDDEVFVELTPGQATTPFEPPGFIIVTSEPSGSEVYLNEQRVGVTPYQNSHISGQYSLLLRNPDYHDHYQTFSLEAGATMAIPTVNLLPRYGFYEVTSTPSGAEVLLNNSLIGHTPLPKTHISSEYHELTVRYSMYHDHTETFTIEDGDHKRFDVELKPAFGGLRLTSEPSGARVFIAGREVGTTPYENMQKPSGRYNVRLSRDLYGDDTETIVISDGETTERFIPLAQNFGSLEVQAADADIYIDGERVGRGSHTADLTPGRHLIKAVKPQHHDDEREVFIRLGQTERITLSPAPKTGYLSIASEPFEASGAEIWIDGVRQQQVTPAVIALLEGSYEVRLKKEEFADAVERVQVRERETTNHILHLGKSITSNVAFVINKYIEAIGGRENLKAVEDVSTEMTASTMGIELQIKSYLKKPHYFMSKMQMGGMTLQQQLFDGEKAIIVSQMGTQEFTEGEMFEMFKMHSVMNIYLHYDDYGFETELLGIENIDGIPAYKVKMISPAGAQSFDYFSTETGLKIKTLTDESNTTYSDYREVSGILIPYKTIQEADSQRIEMRVDNVKINSGLERSFFAID